MLTPVTLAIGTIIKVNGRPVTLRSEVVVMAEGTDLFWAMRPHAALIPSGGKTTFTPPEPKP